MEKYQQKAVTFFLKKYQNNNELWAWIVRAVQIVKLSFDWSSLSSFFLFYYWVNPFIEI